MVGSLVGGDRVGLTLVVGVIDGEGEGRGDAVGVSLAVAVG